MKRNKRQAIGGIGLMVWMLAVGSHAPSAAAETQVIAEKPQDRSHLIISPDGRCVATIGRDGSRYVVRIDGEAGPKFDEIETPQKIKDSDSSAVSSLDARVNFSPDGKRHAYIGRKGDKQHLVIDGETSEAFDRVFLGPFSPDGSRIIAVGMREEQVENQDSPQVFATVLDNGKAAAKYPASQVYDAVLSFVTYSPDGKRVAYIVRPKDDEQVHHGSRIVVDHQPLETEFRPNHNWLPPIVFSDDGKHLAWIAYSRGESKQGSAVVIHDGKPGKTYSCIQELAFAPGSGDVSYVAGDKESGVYVVGDKTTPLANVNVMQGGGGYNKPASWVISSDRRSVAAIVPKGKGHAVNLNGEVGSEYDAIYGLALSPDGQRVAYLANHGGKDYAIVNDEESDALPQRPTHIRYSPGGGRVAAIADSNKSGSTDPMKVKFIGLWDKNGEPIATTDNVNASAFTFAPTGDGYAYIYAGQGGKRVVVVNGGETQLAVNDVKGLAFSPDGKRVGYVTGHYPGTYMSELVVDDQGMGKHPMRFNSGVYFSPDSRHAAFIGNQGGNQIVINGNAGPTFANIYVEGYKTPNTLFFEGDTVRFLAEQDGNVVRVTLPAEGGALVSVASSDAGTATDEAATVDSAGKTESSTDDPVADAKDKAEKEKQSAVDEAEDKLDDQVEKGKKKLKDFFGF